MPQNDNDYKKLFSELIKKQIMVLGPEITLGKVKNVSGLVVGQDGEVQSIEGDPQKMLQDIINQFVDLSGLIVKKTMESIMTTYPAMAGMAASSVFGGTQTSQNAQISTVPTAPITSPVNDQKPVEGPPAMSDMHLESLSTTASNVSVATPPAPQKPTSVEFSASEMEELNKKLAELASAPVASERI